MHSIRKIFVVSLLVFTVFHLVAYIGYYEVGEMILGMPLLKSGFLRTTAFFISSAVLNFAVPSVVTAIVMVIFFGRNKIGKNFVVLMTLNFLLWLRFLVEYGEWGTLSIFDLMSALTALSLASPILIFGSKSQEQNTFI